MKYLGIAIALLTLACFTGCAGSGIQGNIGLGPYGDYTSGTLNLDLEPFLPAPKSYNGQLEK